MIGLKIMAVLLMLFLAHLVTLSVTVGHYTAAGRYTITRMQDRSMLYRLTHLSLLVSSLTALCVLLSGLHHFFLRCQLLSQISQLPLVLLLKLSDSMQLMVTTGRHLLATRSSCRTQRRPQIPTAEWKVMKVNLCTEADEKGSKAKQCHLRLLEVQLPAQLLHLLPGSLLESLQLLQLLSQGFYTLPLPPQGCSMLADEGLAVCLAISQGAFCLPQFCSQPLLSFLNQAMTNCRPAARV